MLEPSILKPTPPIQEVNCFILLSPLKTTNNLHHNLTSTSHHEDNFNKTIGVAIALTTFKG